MRTFSHKKWQSLSLGQRHKVWFEHFLEIEQAIAFGCSVNPLLWEQFALLQAETDVLLSQIYRLWEQGTMHDLQTLYNQLLPLFQTQLQAQKDFHILRYTTVTTNASLPIILILDNLRSAFNVGSIIRTATCLGISEVWFCGYTPTPKHPKVANTAMQTQETITWQHFARTEDAVAKAREAGLQTLALENHPEAISIYEHNYPGNFAIILGNEALGVSKSVLETADHILSIPIPGWKTTLNVATACAVVCFEVYRRALQKEDYA